MLPVPILAHVNTFQESDLQIRFPEDWIVRQFDRTAAYQSLSGHGLKGVDFLCLTPEQELWMVEVKNYRQRNPQSSLKRRSPEALATHVGKKFSDTKRLIHLMNRAMQRNWWVILLLFWQRLGGGDRRDSHYWFWAEAERRLAKPRKIVCLLWMELPERSPDYDSATEAALEEWLEPGNQLRIAGTHDRDSLPLHVTLNPATL